MGGTFCKKHQVEVVCAARKRIAFFVDLSSVIFFLPFLFKVFITSKAIHSCTIPGTVDGTSWLVDDFLLSVSIES